MNGQDSILSELKSMKRRMEILYSKNFPEPLEEPRSQDAEAEWRPLTDIRERENDWLVILDLPGVESHNLRIEVAENWLVVEGVREAPVEEKNGVLRQGERPMGFFRRSAPLPQDIAADGISADFAKGVLTVVIPKKRRAYTRVEIQEG